MESTILERFPYNFFLFAHVSQSKRYMVSVTLEWFPYNFFIIKHVYTSQRYMESTILEWFPYNFFIFHECVGSRSYQLNMPERVFLTNVFPVFLNRPANSESFL